MSPESVKDFYDRQYASYSDRRLPCPNSLHDLQKANRRVRGVLRGFSVGSDLKGATVLDVGSGLGYYTEALSATGASVTGLDFSETAVAAARRQFPTRRFTQGVWPDDVAETAQFDLIWMVNFSLMNTFDVDFINERLIEESMRRLKPHGHLVVGWNSDFSGRTVGGYSHWSMGWLENMARSCRLSPPLVTETRTMWLSGLMIRFAHLAGRSIPFFMARQKLDD